jgi:predicted dehydrogenase
MTLRAHIIDEFGNVETVSSNEFFARVFGHPPLTKQQRLEQWQREVERLADLIEQGCEPDPYGRPAVRDAYLLVAGRKRARAA